MYTYGRKVQYHETDKMGITHHSNYIKWMEEARIAFLDSIGLPFQTIEDLGIVSPVTGIAIDYKYPTTFGDEIEVEVGIVKYSAVKLEVGYTMKNIATGAVAAVGSSKHCFLKDGKIVSLKRESPAMHELLTAQMEDKMIENRKALAQQIVTIAKAAGALIVSSEIGKVTQKGDVSNVVTDIDVKCQQFIIGECAACLPDGGFLAEEDGCQNVGDGYTWVIDPIDGTTNYMYGYRHSCISIALYDRGKGIIGVVYNPFLDECFVGIEGVGSTCNGEAIHASAHEFREALVMAGTAPYDKGLADKTFGIMKKLFMQTRDIRRSGSAALDLCHLAGGRIDAFYELSLQPWDYGAGCIILRNAGGRIEGMTAGAMEVPQPTGIIAANGPCFEPLRDLVCAEVQEKTGACK